MDDQKHVVYVEGEQSGEKVREQSGEKVNLCDSLAQQWKERNRRNKTLVVEHLVQTTTLDLASSDSTDCKHLLHVSCLEGETVLLPLVVLATQVVT